MTSVLGYQSCLSVNMLLRGKNLLNSRSTTDKNLDWKEHIKYTENKIAKNLGLLYKVRPFLDRNVLLALYYSYMQNYINYVNIVGSSACRTTLKKINSQQKHSLRIFLIKKNLPTKGKFLRSRTFFRYIPVKHLSNILFMHRVENKNAPSILLTKFCKPSSTKYFGS